MEKFLKIHPDDNVAVCITGAASGDEFGDVTALAHIPPGHKMALCDIKTGESVIKYGAPIGTAFADIKKGAWVHSHNLKTSLCGETEYSFSPCEGEKTEAVKNLYFYGYERSGGGVGIRNEIWIIPTVGCVNDTARIIAEKANTLYADSCDGVFAVRHPYGCSQLGGDHRATQEALAALCRHPNTAGVLILSLGCENNNLDSFLPVLGEYDSSRIKTLVTQQADDEIEEALALIGEIAAIAQSDERTGLPLSRLTIGMKCGGSDGFSGITANPLCGRIADIVCSCGGRVILSEVPEMFGAETILMSRAVSGDVFEKSVDMINGYKQYFIRHSQQIYENPSPGNKEGGITTLEEKSLGCIQKGGRAAVTDVLEMYEHCKTNGLSLLYGPGNDIVSTTNLTAAGANLILFTTGRGTPLGAQAPTVKISTNSALAKKKPHWIDYDAGAILDGKSFDTAAEELLEIILNIASGTRRAKNELNGFRETAIFKDGVIL
ncbi:MAG: altronate dehydratase [Clostridiales bacterium]|nr:altronate dehydratase [Clostridiales bacterium]